MLPDGVLQPDDPSCLKYIIQRKGRLAKKIEKAKKWQLLQKFQQQNLNRKTTNHTTLQTNKHLS